MGVVRQRGEWLAVQAPELDNGQVGWLRVGDAELSTVPWSLHVDLSNRQLTVRKDGHFVRRLPIAVGSPEHPTPQGRFSVTDKLKVADSGSPYGCCVLALERAPDQAARGLAGRRPAGRARHERPHQHRPAREPRLHARRDAIRPTG